MYPRTQYIENKIKQFQQYNPKIFHKPIRRVIYELYAPIINDFDDKKIIQLGGKPKKDIEFVENFNGYKFRVNIEKTEYDIIVNILTFDKDNPLSCAIINIDIESKLAYLDNVSYYKQCTKPYLVKHGGSTILRLVLNFLKEHKEKFKINRIILKDNSIKACERCPENLELSGMSFLLHGDTWYGKYGFRPFNMKTMKPDSRYIKLYKKNQEVLSKTKVKDVNLLPLIKKAINKYNLKNIDVKDIEYALNELKNNNLSQVLRAMLKDYDKYCCIFAYLQPKLFEILRLQRFHNFHFYLDI